MILLFTDFGWQGPYVGQMKAVIGVRTTTVPVVDLMHDAPAFRPVEAGLLLAALAPRLPRRSVTVAVVDPGVGGERRALMARSRGRWFVGPDNGLLAPVLEADDRHVWSLAVPDGAAPTFHGRDVFAPAAAELAIGHMPTGAAGVTDWLRPEADRQRVIYIDAFGNVMTGLREHDLNGRAPAPAGTALPGARTFCDQPPGAPFWYPNASGLVEIAVNQGSAAEDFRLAVGDPIPLA